ncbi:MAG: nitrile hydratase subunit alpha [Chloroflexi bacterium]|nr:nitrile hydratase subunit alpha [Chloroflexota bacterium]|tara:strand:- start:5053 stop:5688 length:636 start_codon:yes stop_codon:yes gene_type:complete
MNEQHSHDHEHTEPPSSTELRVKSIESLLVEKGLVNSETIDKIIDTYETKVGPNIGKAIIARAWTDPQFKSDLLDKPDIAISAFAEIGGQGEQIRVLENTNQVHNLVVCTLCSCYPWPILGLPPVWYKSAPYRSRAVADPRGVLEQFGTTIPTNVEIRVWDSTSEMRYLVLPQRPEGTENWTEEQLIELVSRNSMIGVEIVNPPTMGTVNE